MNLTSAKTAIESYFASEAAEMYCILGGALTLFLCATVLWWRFGDRFSQSLAVTLLVVGGLLAAMAVGLLVRDSANREHLVTLVVSGNATAAAAPLAAERDRMQAVVDNYGNLRLMFAAGALIGALLIALTHTAVWHAVAVGFLVFALSGVVIDQYSEARARVYLDALAGSL